MIYMIRRPDFTVGRRNRMDYQCRQTRRLETVSWFSCINGWGETGSAGYGGVDPEAVFLLVTENRFLTRGSLKKAMTSA